nr:RNA-directed DNA polymerase, eukaryota, reverse transcriptase zinc-binding domain protein [Tanacetum cinerariifolium]
LCNIPLEAWTTSGISALASRLGKPLIMDTITVKICKKGVGRVKCSNCCVFGHDLKSCVKVDHGKAKAINLEEFNRQDKKKESKVSGVMNDGFTMVRTRKIMG